MAPDQASAEFPVFRHLNVLIRHAGMVLGAGIALAAAALILVLLEPPEYTAESAFLPESASRGSSRVLGLAEQFGLSIGQQSAGESLDFYAALLDSRALLRDVVLSDFPLPEDGGGNSSSPGNLTEWFDLDASTPAGRLNQAISRLRQATAVEVEAGTGLVYLDVTLSAPELAERVNRRMLELVNQFNLSRRQSQARAQREFVEARAREAREALVSAEKAMEQFLEANRSYQDSPQLQFEAARLERRVYFHQQLHGTLAEAYEQARIDEVRDLPVVTVVDAPEESARRNPRRLVLTVLLGLFAGLVLGASLAFAKDFLNHQKQIYPEEYSEFHRLKADKMKRTVGLLKGGTRSSR